MRVQGRNGKWYQRDHPREIQSPYIMKFDEIRYWLRELSTNPEYGWVRRGGMRALEKALGMNPNVLNDKLRIAWIWPGEQIRLTARINDILDGRIVLKDITPCVVGTKIRIPPYRIGPVYVDPPEPPKVSKPKSVRFKVQIGKLKLLTESDGREVKVPQLRDAFRNVPTWKL